MVLYFLPVIFLPSKLCVLLLSAVLPGFVTIDPLSDGGAINYGSAFLPASFQGTRLSSGGGGVPDLSNGRLSDAQQRKQIEFIQKANRKMLTGDPGNPELEGIIQSYELAYKMQTSVPEVLDLDKKPQHIRDMYGLDDGGDWPHRHARSACDGAASARHQSRPAGVSLCRKNFRLNDVSGEVAKDIIA